MREFTISEINALSESTFTAAFGGVFEHSPWVAQRAYFAAPFSNLASLHAAMCGELAAASSEEKLALIRAHPDLGERLAKLTPESTQEQAAAGLDTLTIEELARFNSNNDAYKAKFGFPFVICARLNDKSAMLLAFERRLGNSPEQEFATALEEIKKIASLRLGALILAS